MEISVSKYVDKDQERKKEEYSILDYKILKDNTDLLLIELLTTDIEDEANTKDQDEFHVFKVQFVAVCKTDLSPAMIIAFYLGENGALSPCILSGLPNHYIQENNAFICIDYKSYSEICELTSETKLPLIEYIQKVRNGDMGINSLMIYNEKVYNYDQQQELWKKLDEKKVSIN